MLDRRRVRLRGLALRHGLATLAILAAAAGAMTLLDTVPDSPARTTALASSAVSAPSSFAAEGPPAFVTAEPAVFAAAEPPAAPVPLRSDPSAFDPFPSRGRVALLGLVTDDVGQPLVGADVCVDGTHQICDDQGRFELRGVRIPANGMWIEIGVTAPGFPAWKFLRTTMGLPPPETIRPDEPVGLVETVHSGDALSERIQLPRPARLTGSVLDSKGRPVTGALVKGRLREPGRAVENGLLTCGLDMELETRTSEDGRYEVSVQGPGFWIVEVQAPRLVGTRLSVQVEPGVAYEAPELVLGETGSLRGRVLDTAGLATGGGFRVIAWPDVRSGSVGPPVIGGPDGSSQPIEGSLRETATAADGSFRFAALEPGDWLVAVVPVAQDPVWPGVSTTRIAAGDQAAVELRLGVARRLRGIVVDRGGQPAAGLTIRAREIGRSARHDWQAETVSDARGTFALDVAPDGLVELVASSRERTASVAVAPHDVAEQRLELHPFSGAISCSFSPPTQP